MKTYSIRLFPNEEQVDRLYQLSKLRMDIWNTLIDVQQKEYEVNKKILNKFNLINQIPVLKHSIKPNWKLFNSKAAQTVAVEVFQSYQSFFRLIKKDHTARPPQKKIDINYFHTLSFNQSGWHFNNNQILINKIPFQYKSRIDIQSLLIKEVRVKLRNNKWLADIVVDNNIKFDDNINIYTKILAIDLGIKELGVGIDNDGGTVIIKNKSKRINKYFQKQIANVQSKRSKTTKNSNRSKDLRRTLNKLYHKKNSQIKQALHIQSKKLSNMNYNTIVVGDLQVKKLMSTTGANAGFKKKGVRKGFHQSNINMFLNFLSYKCQAKNINVTKINEAYTTQTNCLTGKKFPTHIDLSQRSLQLNNDIVIDRDLNSAINIMKRFNGYHLASVNKPLEINSNALSAIIAKGSTCL